MQFLAGSWDRLRPRCIQLQIIARRRASVSTGESRDQAAGRRFFEVRCRACLAAFGLVHLAMPDFRAFCAPPNAEPQELTLTPDESHHLVAVNRARVGDTVVAFDGKGTEWICELAG